MLYIKPFDFQSFFASLEADKNVGLKRPAGRFRNAATLIDSIDQVIELILFSHPGECRFFYDFSFSFWGKHLINVSVEQFNNTEFPRSQFEKQLKQVISKYEPRIMNTGVEIFLSEKSVSEVKRNNGFSVHINITGNLTANPDETYQKGVVLNTRMMHPQQ